MTDKIHLFLSVYKFLSAILVIDKFNNEFSFKHFLMPLAECLIEPIIVAGKGNSM